MTKPTIPLKGSRSYALLVALKKGSGTFYQICERAGFDIEEPGVEYALRRIFDRLIGGNARADGIFYSLTASARLALEAKTSPPPVGQVAGPAFRGTPHPATVFITRRPEGVRA